MSNRGKVLSGRLRSAMEWSLSATAVGLEAFGLIEELFAIAMSAEADGPEGRAEMFDDIKGALADGAGGAENGDAFGHGGTI
jgi:hypothetical protein